MERHYGDEYVTYLIIKMRFSSQHCSDAKKPLAIIKYINIALLMYWVRSEVLKTVPAKLQKTCKQVLLLQKISF